MKFFLKRTKRYSFVDCKRNKIAVLNSSMTHAIAVILHLLLSKFMLPSLVCFGLITYLANRTWPPWQCASFECSPEELHALANFAVLAAMRTNLSLPSRGWDTGHPVAHILWLVGGQHSEVNPPPWPVDGYGVRDPSGEQKNHPGGTQT